MAASKKNNGIQVDVTTRRMKKRPGFPPGPDVSAAPRGKENAIGSTASYSQISKQKVPFPNPRVAKAPNNAIQRMSGTAGNAIDPISNQPMKKGSPVPAQSMSKAAQFGRRLGTALDPGFEAPAKKKAKGK